MHSVIKQMPQSLQVEEGFDITFNSSTMVPVIYDWVDLVTFCESTMPMQMYGITHGLTIESTGLKQWHVLDDTEKFQALEIEGYYLLELHLWL